MAEFSEGLLSGFQFVDQLVARRQNARLAEERMGLARAAEQRAQAAFDTQQRQIQSAEQRQIRQDQAAQRLARAQRLGIENLSPEELTALEQDAAFNPQIAAALDEFRLGQRDVEAINELRNLQRPSLSQGVTDAVARRTAGPTVQGTNVDPTLAASLGGVPGPGELPPAQSGDVNRSIFPLSLVDDGEVTTRPALRSVGVGLLRNAGIEVPESAIQRNGGRLEVQVPTDVLQQLETMGDLPVVERQRVINDVQRRLGNHSGEVTRAKLEAEALDDTLTRWRGFLDIDNENGKTLRTEATQDPMSVAMRFREDFNTLKKSDPNTLASVTREMDPIVHEAVSQASARMRSIPVNEQGLVDVNSPEFRRASRELNQLLALQQNMSDEYDDRYEAEIRGNSMPVGNPDLSARMTQILTESPAPGMPASNGELRANMTVARRAVQSVQGGGRNLTTKQVQALAWLAKRNYITPSGFENFLATGSFDDPKSEGFFSHNPDHILFNPDGSVAYMPPNLDPSRERKKWPENFVSEVRRMFEPPPGARAAQVEQARREEAAFYIALDQNPGTLGLAGIDVNRLDELELPDIALLTTRFRAMNEVHSAYEDHWWWGDPVTKLFTGGWEAEGVNPFDRTLDDIARKFGIEVPPLRVPKSQVDAARMGLVSSDDPVQRILGYIGSDSDIDQAIQESVAAQAEAGQ